MECKKCGNTLRNGENFCTECGYYNDWQEAEKEIKKKLEFDEDDEKEKVDFDDDFEDENEEKREEVFPMEKIEVEELLPSFVGDDYEMLQAKRFNFNACFLNWMYFLYRRLTIQGILGLILTGAIIVLFRWFAIIYLVIIGLLLGKVFPSYYLKIAKKRVKKILDKNPKYTRNALEMECKKKGKSSVFFTLLFYAIFLIATIFGLVFFRSILPNGRYEKANNESRKNCNDFVRTVYVDVQNNPQYVYITEGVCSISATNPVYYEVYLKGTESSHNVYFYYSTETGSIVLKDTTEDKIEYEFKQKEGTLTPGEKKILDALTAIEEKYQEIYRAAELEDKNKNKEKKRNYVFSREEITR